MSTDNIQFHGEIRNVAKIPRNFCFLALSQEFPMRLLNEFE